VLTKEARADLAQQAPSMRGFVIEVAGHTDSTEGLGKNSSRGGIPERWRLGGRQSSFDRYREG
jgi:hypothetical protein